MILSNFFVVVFTVTVNTTAH